MTMVGKKVEVISSGKTGVVEGHSTDGGKIKYEVRYDNGRVYKVLAKNIRVIEEQMELPAQAEGKHMQTNKDVLPLLLPAPCSHPALKHVATTTDEIYARCAVCGKRLTVYRAGDLYAGNAILDRLTDQETFFRSISEFMLTPETYSPSLYEDSDERKILADAFDMACRGLHQDRRAYRGILALYESGIPEVIVTPEPELTEPHMEILLE